MTSRVILVIGIKTYLSRFSLIYSILMLESEISSGHNDLEIKRYFGHLCQNIPLLGIILSKSTAERIKLGISFQTIVNSMKLL